MDRAQDDAGAKPVLRTGGWRAVATEDGSITLAHPLHGETCHSNAGAWTQARERYAHACRIRERALELFDAGATHLRLLDVGTGLGLNIAAALEALEMLGGTGVALDVTSVEIDRAVIESAIALGPQPVPELERFHVLVRAALARALQTANGEAIPLGAGRLRLHIGDGREILREIGAHLRCDAVFLDPFSPRVDPPLWEPECLAAIARCMTSGSLLSTYSASLRVRTGLRIAGLRVGPGARVQRKATGTLASPDRDLPPFDARTQRRLLSRSGGRP